MNKEKPICIDLDAIEKEMSPIIQQRKDFKEMQEATAALCTYLAKPDAKRCMLRAIMKHKMTMHHVHEREFRLCGPDGDPQLGTATPDLYRCKRAAEALILCNIGNECDPVLQFTIPADVDEFYDCYPGLKSVITVYKNARKNWYRHLEWSQASLVEWGTSCKCPGPLAKGHKMLKGHVECFYIQVRRVDIDDDVALAKIWDTYFMPEQEENGNDTN